jgi:hypothetical protein
LDLFTEIDSEKEKTVDQVVNVKFERPKIERLESYSQLNKLSLLSQFFLAPFFLKGPDGLLQIPISGKKILLETALDEIVPHFEKVNVIKLGGEIKEITMQNVKTNSRRLFEDLLVNDGLHLVVSDLYGKVIIKNVIGLQHAPFNAKEYKVNMSRIHPLAMPEFNEVWNIINDSFIKINGHFGVMPSNWDFNESFSNHAFIQFLATIECSISVIVNTESNSIFCVLIKGPVLT